MSRTPAEDAVVIGLNAAIVTVTGDEPVVLAVRHAAGGGPGVRAERDGLPFGPFEPFSHRTLDQGVRLWVRGQTGLEIGYAEQLYTFGDRGRHELKPGEGPRVVSVGYLALVRAAAAAPSTETRWRSWYDYFPWEDARETAPAVTAAVILPALKAWAAEGPGAAREARLDRIALLFGLDGLAFDEEKTLERYELLYEAGLVDEALRDGREGARPLGGLGQPMIFDHRRILATAMGRLRGKLKYRPVVFELMPPEFTLLELQRTVEAISGTRLHKQNFRRLVETSGLVEGTGRMSAQGVGRPAEKFRFRKEVLRERPAPGVKLSGPRARR
jgi:hypothetical protein